MTAALALTGISKRYGAVTALQDVAFELAPGEIHALLGENGAGKSTLMKIAFGLVSPDAGSIMLHGAPVRLRDPTDARRYGIGMVHQHFTSIPAFSVAENVALAAGWRPGRKAVAERVSQLSEQTGLLLDPDAIVVNLSAELKQRLEVLKALAAGARILLFDEPSSVLPPREVSALLAMIAGFRDRGIASVLITHKLDEALSIADRVTVLRRGVVVHHGPVRGESAATLATHMLGSAPPARGRRPPAKEGEVRVALAGVVVRPLAGGSGLCGVTCTVRGGEILGVAAVEGNGQRELLRGIAGLAPLASGTRTVAAPVAFIPEDRISEGLIGPFSLTENLVLARGRDAAWINGPWVDWPGARRRAGELITEYGVRAGGPDAAAASLSGGNQQRMLVAAALDKQPAVLVAENPTRGLDLRATAEIHERLRDAAGRGVAVVVHLADLDELLEVASRIVVLSNGILTEMPAASGRDRIGHQMLAVSTE